MSLSVSFNLPPELEDRLRRESRDLNTDVKEAFALELFRRGTLSHYELSQILGLDRFETDAWLKRHGVFEGSPTATDVDQDRRTLDGLFRRAS
jgi:predicted HTH domain antitoxin